VRKGRSELEAQRKERETSAEALAGTPTPPPPPHFWPSLFRLKSKSRNDTMLQIAATKRITPSAGIWQMREIYHSLLRGEPDVLAFMNYPTSHRAKLHSTNPIERLNGEIKLCVDVIGIFPNEAAIRRLVGAILLEQNDE